MEEFLNSDKEEQVERGNPITLMLLFYVLTASAIIASSYQYIRADKNYSLGQITNSIILGAIIGVFIGIVVMFRRKSYVWMAPLLGPLLGVAIGPLIRIKIEYFSSLIALSFGGCWFLIVMMCVAARFKRRRVSRETSQF